MILENNNNYQSFEKKIIPYLDGSLTMEDASEFEAFVSTHSEFEKKVRAKEQEIENLKKMIPVAVITKDSLESIQSEMRVSIFNLLTEEPKGFFDHVRIKWEEWRSR
jgi:hypothetical protein